MARFWWGSSASNRKIHGKSWESLCTLKCFGGLGFRDLTVSNDALLGRQAWRLSREPTSLFARVMKAKYYPQCDFLQASLGVSCTYSWKSIWSSKALLKEGSIWRVGNGENYISLKTLISILLTFTSIISKEEIADAATFQRCRESGV